MATPGDGPTGSTFAWDEPNPYFALYKACKYSIVQLQSSLYWGCLWKYTHTTYTN